MQVDAKTKTDARGQAEQRLQAELSTVGGTFSPDQINQYKEAFWAQDGNKKIKDDAAASTDALASTLKTSKRQLEAEAARRGRGFAGRALAR